MYCTEIFWHKQGNFSCIAHVQEQGALHHYIYKKVQKKLKTQPKRHITSDTLKHMTF